MGKILHIFQQQKNHNFSRETIQMPPRVVLFGGQGISS